jgi:lipid-binding SYLF domain-containing protein
MNPPRNKLVLFGAGGLVLLILAMAVIVATKSSIFNDPVAVLKRSATDIPKEEDRLSVQSALIEFEKSGALAPYFANSYGCAVFPTIGKGGFGIGGAHGAGWVFKRGSLTGISKMTQLTIGFQAGGQAYSQIIFFENKAAYTQFTGGNFEFGAQASAVALTVGANASASTAGGATAGVGTTQTKSAYTSGMAVFTLAKGGLMYEASLGGQKFSFTAELK